MSVAHDDEQFYVRSAGRVMGPFTTSRLRELKRLGRLPEFCDVSRDRLKWEPVARILEEPKPVAQVVQQPQASASPPKSSEIWYYTDANGEKIGPVDREKVTSLASAGLVDDQTMVWRSGMNDWEPYLDVFPKSQTTTAKSAKYSFAEIGGLLLLIASWVWTTALIVLTLTWAVSWAREKMVSMVLFLPGILGLVHLLLVPVALSFLLTLPGRHGIRPSAITGLVFSALHFFLLLFVVGDWADSLGDRKLGMDFRSSAVAWVPVTTCLPFSTMLASMFVYAKKVEAAAVLMIVAAMLEIGKLVCTLFALRGVALFSRQTSAKMMSLAGLITTGTVLFALNLVVLAAMQQLQSYDTDGKPEALKQATKILLWTVIGVYTSCAILGLLYGLASTFSYLGLRRLNGK